MRYLVLHRRVPVCNDLLVRVVGGRLELALLDVVRYSQVLTLQRRRVIEAEVLAHVLSAELMCVWGQRLVEELFSLSIAQVVVGKRRMSWSKGSKMSIVGSNGSSSNDAGLLDVWGDGDTRHGLILVVGHQRLDSLLAQVC